MDLRDAGIYDMKNLFTGEPSRYHTGATSGGSIINSQKERTINIPAYQRPYRWGKDNIDRLFIDYYDENKSDQYFLGSAVAVEKKHEGKTQFDLVDGQQRITTLYLLNYLRFLIVRERFYLAINNNVLTTKIERFFDDLTISYDHMVGCKNNDNKFKKIKETIDSLDSIADINTKAEVMIKNIKENLCFAESKNTIQETCKEITRRMKEFFENEQLSITYSRKRYSELLTEAMCHVHIETSTMTTSIELAGTTKYEYENDNDFRFIEPYVNAMKYLFENVIEKANEKTPNSENTLTTLSSAYDIITDLLNNLSFCVVVTANEEDAYKLFEVLNDRNLVMEDLELIKNLFYREYCTKSGETSSQIIDNNISALDEIWNDYVFDNVRSTDGKLISFFAAVFLTADKDLDNKNNAKYKSAIENKYTKEYSKEMKPYQFDIIKRDFNVYYAIKLLLDTIKLAYQKPGQNACAVEVNKEVSITFKTFHMLNAMNLPAVMASLVNLIIATYWHIYNEFSEMTFKEFAQKIKEDKYHKEQDLKRIHLYASYLWSACIRAENYKIPRKIASEIIQRFNIKEYDNHSIAFSEFDYELNQSFEKWIEAYRYGRTDDIKIKLLMLRLLTWGRPNSDHIGYKATNVELEKSAMSYNLEGAKIQLDHLEPLKPRPGILQYFMLDSLEKRQMIVNSYLGNFMILDGEQNNKKNNMPLETAVSEYYSKLSSSWLMQDIKDMINDIEFFDIEKRIPNEEFFIYRTARLIKYFKAILNKGIDLDTDKIIVNF